MTSTTTPSPLPTIISPTKSSIGTNNNTTLHQIYEGQKFYWRQRLNVDLNFIFHRTDKLLEIISYDSDKSMELNRIYLSSDAVYDCISPDLHQKVQEMKKDLSRDRFKKVPPDSELIIKVGDNLIAQFILNRLIVVTENDINIMKLSLLSADTFDLSKLIVEKKETENQSEISNVNTEEAEPISQPQPTQVKEVPKPNEAKVKINRRRKTTSGEFDRALNHLRQNSMELNQACDRAAKLTELSSKSVTSFKEALKMHATKYDKSKPIDRFKWAVRRVILNNTVDRVRQQLSKHEKSKTPLRINATFPLPDGSIINPANAAAQLQRIPLLTKIHEAYSNGPSPFQSPIVTPRGKGTRTPPTSSMTESHNSIPSVNHRKSSGKTLMASQSMPVEPTPAVSPQNANGVHLPVLKDKSPSNGASASTKDKKKTSKK